MNLLKLTLTILLYGLTTNASAKLVQIIHTNDLHSFFDGSRSGLGGYSRIKTLVDRLKADAASKGIKTLFLDAGDFGEGSSYYFSNKGVDAFKALDLLGVDATVLGNHDFIFGGKELKRQLTESNLKANFLSANMKGKALMGLSKKVKSYVDYDIDGMKIRIFGLTTPEIHFQYPLLPLGYIGPSHKKGIKIAEKSKKDGVDFLIGLTHIGIGKDETLISHSRSINMIIGGHSHTRLDQPRMIENLNGDLIPAFQTGAHGTAVGSLIVDILGEGDAKMIDYRLYDVSQDIPEDEEIKKFVDEAYINREKYFNRNWTEVIGFSEIPLTGMYQGIVRNAKSCWSQHIAKLTREVAKSDISIQFDIFQGEEIPAGPIKFGDLIDNFPHFRTWGDQGWNISRANISGILLKQVLKLVTSGPNAFDATIDGVQVYDAEKGMLIPFQSGDHSVEEVLIDGEKIKNLKFYSVAIPSEITYGFGKFSTPLRNFLLPFTRDVKNSYFWPLFEDYIKNNSPLKCSN